MVSKLFLPGKNGVADWLIQRVSAVILALYVLSLLSVFLFFGKKIDFLWWQTLFSCWIVKTFTLLALISLLLHAWVGVWIVLTDYIRCAWLRLSFVLLLMLSLFFYLLWGINLLWRIA